MWARKHRGAGRALSGALVAIVVNCRCLPQGRTAFEPVGDGIAKVGVTLLAKCSIGDGTEHSDCVSASPIGPQFRFRQTPFQDYGRESVLPAPQGQNTDWARLHRTGDVQNSKFLMRQKS